MKNFLKNFFTNEKSPEEQALMKSAQQRDVINLNGTAAEEDDCDDTPMTGGGCCGGGCRS